MKLPDLHVTSTTVAVRHLLIGLLVVVQAFSTGAKGESLNDATIVQSAEVEDLHTGLLGIQSLNEVAAPRLADGASIRQNIGGNTIHADAGIISINSVNTFGTLRRTSIIQNYSVGETSASMGWIQVNSVILSGFGAPKRILQSHSGSSVSSSGWPVFINIYAN